MISPRGRETAGLDPRWKRLLPPANEHGPSLQVGARWPQFERNGIRDPRRGLAHLLFRHGAATPYVKASATPPDKRDKHTFALAPTKAGFALRSRMTC